MHRFLIIFLFKLIPFCSAQSLYTEDVLAAMPERIKQWKQMVSYADSLSENNMLNSTKDKLADKIGYPPSRIIENTAVRQEKSGEDTVATYYRIWVHISPEMDTYGLYIVPKGLKQPAPLVIALHGGGGFPELAVFYARSNYHDMVRGAVLRGYVVYAPLFIFYPYHDRDHGTSIPKDVREVLDKKFRYHGTTLMAVEVVKITKALDILIKRPEVDPKRIAMIGLSWGGAYTQYATALDPRIRVAVFSCSFQTELTTRPSFGKHEDVSTVQLTNLILPRSIQLQFGEHDPLLSIVKVRSGIKGIDKRVDIEIANGAHEFNGLLAWPFINSHL
jgi:dienelactone hydrolase